MKINILRYKPPRNMLIERKHFPHHHQGRFRALLFCSTRSCSAVYRRHSPHPAYHSHLKLEQPSDGQGMEIGEWEKTNQRLPINFQLLHCSCPAGERQPFQAGSECCWPLHPFLSSLQKRGLENANYRSYSRTTGIL